MAKRSIELTDMELKAYDEFQAALDAGLSIMQAQQQVKEHYRRSCRAVFYRWLISGSVS